jgi:hypothetical protein
MQDAKYNAVLKNSASLVSWKVCLEFHALGLTVTENSAGTVIKSYDYK